jgi:hypothetical protein
MEIASFYKAEDGTLFEKRSDCEAYESGKVIDVSASVAVHKLQWYHYSQNNSGGSFTGPALDVYIQASNSNEADAIAEDNELYFDGCSRGWDCSCCGDRWYPCYGEGEDSLDIESICSRERYGSGRSAADFMIVPYGRKPILSTDEHGIKQLTDS